MNPIIGIVICGLADNRQFVTDAYIQAIENAGGVPLVIPRVENSTHLLCCSAICDGFLFCGGDDISPRLFGEDLLTDKGYTDERTDRFHLELMHHLLPLSHPLLCICRGMQVLNIALGGSIYQDISLREGHCINHMQISGSREDVCHRVSFSYDSMLYNICGDHIETNSFHHQCLKNTGRDLKITGVTADGVPEAIESTSRSFCVGIQWHPECMYHSSPPMRELFFRFIDHARNAKTISVPIDFS